MELKEIRAIIEALLFVSGDALSVKEIAAVIGQDEEVTRRIIKQTADTYNEADRGLMIIEINGSYQFATKPELYPYIELLIKPHTKQGLSQAALEALAVIAYKQPVTKSEIESIRGVKCDTCVARLVDKELIEEGGRMDGPGRPILYKTTENFLRLFGLRSLGDLPPVDMFSVIDVDVDNVGGENGDK